MSRRVKTASEIMIEKHQSPKRKRCGSDGVAKKSNVRKTNNISGIGDSIDLSTSVERIRTSTDGKNAVYAKEICSNNNNSSKPLPMTFGTALRKYLSLSLQNIA